MTKYTKLPKPKDSLFDIKLTTAERRLLLVQIFVKILQEIQPIPLRKIGIGPIPIPILKVGIGSIPIPIPKNVRQYPKMGGQVYN